MPDRYGKHCCFATVHWSPEVKARAGVSGVSFTYDLSIRSRLNTGHDFEFVSPMHKTSWSLTGLK